MEAMESKLAYGRMSVDENEYRDMSHDEYEGSAGEPMPRSQSPAADMQVPGSSYVDDAAMEDPAFRPAPSMQPGMPSQTGSFARQGNPSQTGGFPRQGGYVRPARPRKTQPTISEPQNTKYPSDYTHDSGIAIGGGGPLSGASYRRSRSEMKRLQRDLHYGQYLEIPKGRRSIFASQERARRTRSVIALAVVVAILAIADICVWQLMVSRFGL